MPPTYLYHATKYTNAASIATNGLLPRSVGGEEGTYLCMSGTLSGATTLERRANDIIFRAAFSGLQAAAWAERGAGSNEWRSSEGIAADLLEYKRNLGNASQQTWRSAASFPEGV